MTDEIKPTIEPRCPAHALHRLTENGDGAVRFGLVVDDSLETVMGDKYFLKTGSQGLQRLDIIELWADANTNSPTYCELFVTAVRTGHARVVLKKGTRQKVECEPRSCFEVLGIDPSASSLEIDAAYRRKARHAHPDSPSGSAAKFQAIQEARDACLLVAENRAA